MTADFSHLKDGWYIGAIYEGSRSMTGSIRFHIQRESVAVDEVDAEAKNTKIYDLNGIRHSSPSDHGILIIDGKKVMKRN